MRTRPLGTTGVELPVFGQGTWNFEHDAAEAVRSMLRGFELGMTHVDTAEMYGDGRVEEIVGQALAAWHGDEVFVTSKVLPSNASRAGTVAACERSLARLGCERIDLYLLHWPGSFPFEETLAGFADLQRAGKVRFFGVSNFDADELSAAAELAGPGRIACNQVLYHLEERAIEHRVLPRCSSLDASLVAYSPFGSGNFPDPGSPGGAALARVARTSGATPRQLALAFLTRDPAVLAIPKAATVAHVEENAAGAALVLEEADLDLLVEGFPRGPEPRHLPVI